MATYQMIPRWMPFAIPIYIDPIGMVFSHLKSLVTGSAGTELQENGPVEVQMKFDMGEEAESMFA